MEEGAKPWAHPVAMKRSIAAHPALAGSAYSVECDPAPGQLHHDRYRVADPDPAPLPQCADHRAPATRLGQIEDGEQDQHDGQGHARVVEDGADCEADHRNHQVTTFPGQGVPDQSVEGQEICCHRRKAVDAWRPPSEGDAEEAGTGGDGGEADDRRPGSEQQFQQPVEDEHNRRVQHDHHQVRLIAGYRMLCG